MKWNNKGQMFDALAPYYKDLETIYLYGAGTGDGLRLYTFIENAVTMLAPPQDRLNIKFVDRNPEKQAAGYLGCPVLSPQAFLEACKPDGKSMVVTCVWAGSEDALLEELQEKVGLERGKNLLPWWELQPRWFSVVLWHRYQKLFLWTVDIIAHTYCNLRCKNCLIMTPQRKKKWRQDAQTYIQHMDRFFDKVDAVIDFTIGIGEGFMYNDYEPIFAHLRERYSHRFCTISVVTNGTILPSEALLSLLQRYQIRVVVDDYRTHVPLARENFQKVVDALRQRDIACLEAYRGEQSWWDVRLGEVDYTALGAEGLTKKMDACSCGVAGFPYFGLEEDKLYRCLMSALAREFSIGQETEKDYLRLSAASKGEILEFILGYTDTGALDACAHCDFDDKCRVDAGIQEEDA